MEPGCMNGVYSCDEAEWRGSEYVVLLSWG